jgi:hypothetical protein
MQEQEVRQKLAQMAKQLGLRMPEVQLLLCQERFLARLGGIPEGRAFIWKGGSLILRLYRIESLPRYTIDIDLTVSGIPVSNVQAAFEKAMAVDLKGTKSGPRAITIRCKGPLRMVPPKPLPSLQRVVQVGLQLNGSRWGELMDAYFAQYSGHSSMICGEDLR